MLLEVNAPENDTLHKAQVLFQSLDVINENFTLKEYIFQHQLLHEMKCNVLH